MKRRSFFGAADAAACAVGVRAQPSVRTEGWYNVRDHSATGGGATNDTKAIQTAIDRCSRTGGRVVFPPGRYRTGMVRLKSHKIHASGDAHDVFVPGPNLSKGPRPCGILLHRCRNISLAGTTLENPGFRNEPPRLRSLSKDISGTYRLTGSIAFAVGGTPT